jgi:diaminopropionate ammonia-lyase
MSSLFRQELGDWRATVSWFFKTFGASAPLIVSCEPLNAACVMESLRAGEPVVVDGSLETIMAGLSAGIVSRVAWPVLRSGLDAAVAITDEECRATVRELARPDSADQAHERPARAGEGSG